jgi:hypothetical protein
VEVKMMDDVSTVEEGCEHDIDPRCSRADLVDDMICVIVCCTQCNMRGEMITPSPTVVWDDE